MSGVNARRFSERTRDCHCGLCNTCWIINCRFPEAVQLANLCTVILNSAPAPLILFESLRCDFDRFAINSTTVGTADFCFGNNVVTSRKVTGFSPVSYPLTSTGSGV